jgi:hypothetical protein
MAVVERSIPPPRPDAHAHAADIHADACPGSDVRARPSADIGPDAVHIHARANAVDIRAGADTVNPRAGADSIDVRPDSATSRGSRPDAADVGAYASARVRSDAADIRADAADIRPDAADVGSYADVCSRAGAGSDAADIDATADTANIRAGADAAHSGAAADAAASAAADSSTDPTANTASANANLSG